MSDLRQCSRDFITEFIELYKNYPCLWRVGTKEYSDREKKTKAYEMMVRKFREIDPRANRETVTKKINSLRTVCRKEVIKINKSIQGGATGDEVYKPSVWYFELFSFLRDQEIPKDSFDYMDNDSVATVYDVKQEIDEVDINDMDTTSYTAETDITMTSPSQEQWALACIRDCSCSTSASSSARKRRLPSVEKVPTPIPDKESLKTDDSFEVFGKHVANKLRTLTRHQNIFAVKLINDVLFEAEMESLDRGSKLFTPGATPGGHLGPDGRLC